MESGLRGGAFPSKVTVPLTVEAADATPGHTNTAISPAARHNLFPIARMLGSLIGSLRFSIVTVDAAQPLKWADSTPARRSVQPRRTASEPPGSSSAPIRPAETVGYECGVTRRRQPTQVWRREIVYITTEHFLTAVLADAATSSNRSAEGSVTGRRTAVIP
jgi:hypothetical protein